MLSRTVYLKCKLNNDNFILLFSRKYFLNMHIRSYLEKNKILLIKIMKRRILMFICSICNEDFADRSDYVDHLLSHLEAMSSIFNRN